VSEALRCFTEKNTSLKDKSTKIVMLYQANAPTLTV